MQFTKYNIKPFPTSSVKDDIQLSSNIHKANIITRRTRSHLKVKRQYKTKSDDEPGGREQLSIMPSTAEFTYSCKLGCFAFLYNFARCRSPPFVLHFSDSKI